MIYMYIQQGVLATKSSHMKVPSQVSLTDCLVFKQQKTIWVIHSETSSSLSSASAKVGIYKSSYGSDFPSETYPSPHPKHLEFT